jgi:hypothetical protein
MPHRPSEIEAKVDPRLSAAMLSSWRARRCVVRHASWRGNTEQDGTTLRSVPFRELSNGDPRALLRPLQRLDHVLSRKTADSFMHLNHLDYFAFSLAIDPIMVPIHENHGPIRA